MRHPLKQLMPEPNPNAQPEYESGLVEIAIETKEQLDEALTKAKSLPEKVALSLNYRANGTDRGGNRRRAESIAQLLKDERQKNRLLLAPRFFNRVLAPRIPVHRIILVLQQIWTRFVGKTIGHGSKCMMCDVR